MKLTPEKLAQLKALEMPAWLARKYDVWAHAAAEAIPALIADLEEATATRGNSVLVPAPKLEEMQAEIRALRKQLENSERVARHEHIVAESAIKQLAEAQSSEAHWRANHDNVVRKLRFFTQRDDLPVDRLQAYEYVLELEKQLAGGEQPSELEMHRADYQACKDAGWESLGELLSAYKTLEKQLAEAQALNAQLLSVAEKMRCAGGAQEFQHWFDELKLFLLSKPDTSALGAAIAAKGENHEASRHLSNCLHTRADCL